MFCILRNRTYKVKQGFYNLLNYLFFSNDLKPLNSSNLNFCLTVLFSVEFSNSACKYAFLRVRAEAKQNLFSGGVF